MNERGTLAYVSHYFPTLTQTFVYREIFALEALGWKVKPFAIRRPTKGIHAEATEIAARTAYLVPLPPLRFLSRQLALLARRPIRYLGLLLFLITRPGERLRSRLHALTHFFGGIHLAAEIREAGARHVHAHFGRNPATLAMVAARYLDIPFSMTIHARDLFVDAALLRAKIDAARFVATISEYNRGLLEGHASSPEAASKIHVIHCGIDPARFSPAGEEGRRRRAPGDRPLFLAVGRLVPKKGYRYLVEAAGILEERGVPVQVRIVGGGPDREELEERGRKLGLAGRLRLDGPMPQESILELLRQADAFVLPCVRAPDGDQDGIPVSLMEAMACEVPCVSTDLSGIPELIEDGAEGLLVPEKDPAALADALQRLAEDPDLGRRLGRAARAKVERAFTLDAEARAMDRLFLGRGE